MTEEVEKEKRRMCLISSPLDPPIAQDQFWSIYNGNRDSFLLLAQTTYHSLQIINEMSAEDRKKTNLFPFDSPFQVRKNTLNWNEYDGWIWEEIKNILMTQAKKCIIPKNWLTVYQKYMSDKRSVF